MTGLTRIVLMFELRLRSLMASLAVHIEAWALEEPVALLDAGDSTHLRRRHIYLCPSG